LSSGLGLGRLGGGSLGVLLLGGGLSGGGSLRVLLASSCGGGGGSGLASGLGGGSLGVDLLGFSLGSSGILLFLGGGFDSLLSQVLEELDVFSGSLLGSLPSFLLFFLIDSLSSESDVSDESLDLRGLPVGLSVLFNLSGVKKNKSSWVVFLLKIEQLSNSGGSLGTESSGLLVISQSSDGLFTGLNNREGKNGEIGTDDASSDGLSLSFT